MNDVKRILLSLFVLLTATIAQADVEINETNFPDEDFRKWILAKDYGKDGVLTDEEIASVTKIVFYIYTIQNLKGIEFFTELTTLNCSANQLTELDVSKCTKLTELDCCWNQLASLDVSKNTALTRLVCGANPLTELDVSQNIALKELYCQNNQLTSLDVSANTELTILACKQNQLTELDVSKNKELNRLICSNNQLTTLDLKSMTKLESLDCVRNRLERINVSDCPDLWEVDCFNNRIKGEAMDALIEGLAFIPQGWGHFCVIDSVNEQNVMTKTQVAAAKAKGWNPRYVYGAFGTRGHPDYEGVDEATGIGATLNDKEEMTNDSWYDLQGRRLSGKPERGIYINTGRKVLMR